MMLPTALCVMRSIIVQDRLGLQAVMPGETGLVQRRVFEGGGGLAGVVMRGSELGQCFPLGHLDRSCAKCAPVEMLLVGRLRALSRGALQIAARRGVTRFTGLLVQVNRAGHVDVYPFALFV